MVTPGTDKHLMRIYNFLCVTIWTKSFQRFDFL